MNERIQQFAEQARTSVPAGLDTVEWIAEYNRIFAELIVRECIDLARICECIDGSRDPDDYTRGCHDAIHITIKRMASEFGVDQ